MRNVAILTGICKMLHERFPDIDILIDENEEEIKAPTFFVQVNKLSNDQEFFLINKRVNCFVTYITPNDKILTEDKLNMIDDIQNIFTRYITINEKKKIPIFNNDVLDNQNTVRLTTEFYDVPDPVEENDYYEELMSIINIKYETNKEK